MLILDLCGGTGSWSEPYRQAGCDTMVVDPVASGQTVRQFLHDVDELDVHGILAAPPCTEFSGSGARWWAGKNPRLLADAIQVVRDCLEIIKRFQPLWWALENPVGRLARVVPELGKWKYTFQPYQYSDPWTKRTCIWGEHNDPIKNVVEPVGLWTGGTPSGKLGIVDHPEYLPSDWVHKLPPSADRATLRSITPPGFAKAFFNANQ